MTGIVIVDKPAGWTSFDVAAKLRGLFHERRIGHGGTLDPMATGVLPLFLGRATRAVPFFEEDADKEYVAGLRLGLETDTEDVTGQVLSQRPVSVSRAALTAALEAMTGPQMQTPPMYSAVRVNGQRLYDLARQGKTVARKARPVTFYELELLDGAEADWTIRVRCSKGAYVRTLCAELGRTLGCGGCMSSLRRTMAAGFTLAECRTIEEVQQQGESLLAATDSLFRQYPAYRIPSEQADRRCRCGNPLTAEGLQPGLYRVYGTDGTFLCLSRWENGVLTSEKNFFGA